MTMSNDVGKKKDDFPKDYPVPNFGGEKETYMTLDHLNLAEKEYGHKLNVKKFSAENEYPKDYTVPNFGQDEDVIGTANSLAQAEKQLNHKMFAEGEKAFVQLDEVREPLLSRDNDFKTAAKTFKADREDWEKDYKVPSFGRDKETYMTLDHIKQTEAKMNTTFNIGNYTNWSKCNGPCDILAKEKDYPVVNLGVDKDILTTNENLKEAEKEVGAVWNVNQLMLEQFVSVDDELV